MSTIYQWHVDFVGNNGLITANTIDEARVKLLSKFELDEFSLRNLQIKHLFNLEHAEFLLNELSNDKIVTFNRYKLIEK